VYGVTVLPGKAVEVIPTAPRDEAPAARPAVAHASGGLSPAWFWIGVAATALAGGATVLSALDTASKNDDFAADRSNVDASNAGRAAERRTVLLGVTSGVLAVATGVVGAFFVTWKHDAVSASATVGLRF
jgi:ABC-type Fe3+ transport system permease subunit